MGFCPASKVFFWFYGGLQGSYGFMCFMGIDRVT